MRLVEEPGFEGDFGNGLPGMGECGFGGLQTQPANVFTDRAPVSPSKRPRKMRLVDAEAAGEFA
jgi:hypothetical protein